MPSVPSRSDRRRASPSRARAAWRERFFPGASPRDWDDWRWQLRHRVRDLAGLTRLLRLSDAERSALGPQARGLPLAITPYYASLLDPEDPTQPLRRTLVPTEAEFRHGPGEAADPLGEASQSPVPGLVHRYPDRALFLVTDGCAAYCRYCTRSRLVGQVAGRQSGIPAQWEAALARIRATPAIRDVLLSGGDPLTLSDRRLDWLLEQLRAIPHVEIIRLGSKVPAVLPQRITPGLARLLRRHRPLWASLHFTHPDELTPETARACDRLLSAGIPLGSQTVLLAGINDRLEVMRPLMQGLLRIGVRPYYLYQCDPILGSAHFRTPVRRGLEILAGLQGHTSGYAVPHYVIDAPGGGGKIPLLPEYVQGWDAQGNLLLRNYAGQPFHYPDGAIPPTLPDP